MNYDNISLTKKFINLCNSLDDVLMCSITLNTFNKNGLNRPKYATKTASVYNELQSFRRKKSANSAWHFR